MMEARVAGISLGMKRYPIGKQRAKEVGDIVMGEIVLAVG